jgi:type I restriction enzyme, S subunit
MSEWKKVIIKQSSYLKGRIGWQGLKASEFTNIGPYLVTGTDFVNGKIDWNKCYRVSEKRYNEAKYIQLKNHDLLITKDGTIGKIAYVEKCPKQAVLNSGIFLLRCEDNSYIHRYLYYILHSELFEEFLTKNLNGSTINHLYQYVFENFEFFAPSLPTQRKIARVLSTADAIIEKIQAAIAKYKAIKQGMLHDLFTRGIDPATNKLRPTYEDAPHLYKPSKWGWIPKEWEEKKIEDIAKVNGRVGWKGYTVSDLREVGPLALGATHIDKDNKLDLTNPIYLSFEKYFESPEIMVQFMDILIVQRGTIGKVVIIDKEIGEATINPSMVLLNNIKLNKFFLFYQLIGFIGQMQIENLTSQTGVPMISQEQINNILIIKPYNDAETNVIAERLKSIDSQLQIEQTYLKKLQQIKAGLMADLLSGKKEVHVDEQPAT